MVVCERLFLYLETRIAVSAINDHCFKSYSMYSIGNGVLAFCDVAGQLGTLVNCYGKESSKFGADSEDVEMVERADGEFSVHSCILRFLKSFIEF